MDHAQVVELKIKIAHSITLGTGMVEAEPVITVVEKAVMQDVEETGSGMVKAGPEKLDVGLK